MVHNDEKPVNIPQANPVTLYAASKASNSGESSRKRARENLEKPFRLMEDVRFSDVSFSAGESREDFEKEVFRLMKEVNFSKSKPFARDGLRSLTDEQLLTIYEAVFMHHLELIRLRKKFCVMVIKNRHF